MEWFVGVVTYFVFQVELWNWPGPLGRVCVSALVGVTFRILSEGMFLLSPLLLLLEGMTVVVLGRVCCLVWESGVGGLLVGYGYMSRRHGDLLLVEIMWVTPPSCLLS